MSLKLTIAGCCGRMGQRIARLALQDSRYILAAVFESHAHTAIGRVLAELLPESKAQGLTIQGDAKAAMAQGHVTIDFTSPEATDEHVQLAVQLGKAMVIGTTGLSQQQVASVRQAAQRIPIVMSPNMSLGVNVLFDLAQLAAVRLGTSFDVAIVESHHKHKKDAPSGTAKRLAQVVESARKEQTNAVAIHSVRAGEIIGDHTVIFSGPSECLELTHRAQTRETFAEGALVAAEFVHSQPPGLYDMSNVIKWRAASTVSRE